MKAASNKQPLFKPLTRDQYKHQSAVKLGPSNDIGKAEDAALAFCQLAAAARLGSALYLKTGKGMEDYFSQHGPSFLKKLKRLFADTPKNEKTGADTRTKDTLNRLKAHPSLAVRTAATELVNALAQSRQLPSDKLRFDTAVKLASNHLSLAILQHRENPRPTVHVITKRPSTSGEQHRIDAPHGSDASVIGEPDMAASGSVAEFMSSQVEDDSPSQEEDEPAPHTSDDAQHTETSADMPAVAEPVVAPVVVTPAQPVQATVAPQPQKIGHVKRNAEGEVLGAYHDNNALPDLAMYIGKAPLGSVLSLYEDDDGQLMVLAEPVASGQAIPQPHPFDAHNLCMTLKGLVEPFTTSDNHMLRSHANIVMRHVEASAESGQPLTVHHQLQTSLEKVYNESSKASS